MNAVCEQLPSRQRLPNRRACDRHVMEHAGIKYVVEIGRDFDGCTGSGEIGEIFLSTLKGSSDLDAQARDAGLLFSLALQHGCPIETILGALTRDGRGRPAGALGRAIEFAIEQQKEWSP